MSPAAKAIAGAVGTNDMEVVTTMVAYLLVFAVLCGAAVGMRALMENGLPHQCAHWFAMTEAEERGNDHV